MERKSVRVIRTNSNMKIGIVGYGFVGKTVSDFLESKGIETLKVDPKYFDTEFKDIEQVVDAFIVCVGTPEDPATGKIDPDSLQRALGAFTVEKPTLLKSTVTPDLLENLPDYITYSPEFLREAHAAEDFANQHTIILGYDDFTAPHASHALPYVKWWKEFWNNLLPESEIVITTRATASMIKYTHNAWLATKIAFFHDLYLHMPANVDWNTMTDALARFPTVGASHMKVPNAEGGLGFGGNCFPKDISAFQKYLDSQLLHKVILINDDLKKRSGPVTLDFLKANVPNKPYMLVLGTSHTYGQCDGGIVSKVYHEHLAERYGLEVVNVGNPGVKNIEFVQMMNELERIGALGENCKLLLLEPRLTDNTVDVAFEGWTDWTLIDDAIKRHRVANIPLITRSRIKSDNLNDDGKIMFPHTVNNMLYEKYGPTQATESHATRLTQLMLGNNDNMHHIDKRQVRKSMEVTEYKLGYESHTVANAFNDIQIVDFIKNYARAKNIPFAWLLIDPKDNNIQIIKDMWGRSTDIFDYMLLGKSVNSQLMQQLGIRDPEEMKKYKCTCMHFDAVGNKMIANILAPELERMFEWLQPTDTNENSK
jgi:hypothetical protein